jgi:prophage regulatory protein
MSDRPKKFLRLRVVEERAGKKKSSIYADIAKGKFPKPVPLGDAPNSPVGWIEEELERWQADRIARRDARSVA